MIDLARELVEQAKDNPAVLLFVAGFVAGWHAARRSTRYMLGGRL